MKSEITLEEKLQSILIKKNEIGSKTLFEMTMNEVREFFYLEEQVKILKQEKEKAKR